MPEQDNETNTQGTDHRPGPLEGLLIADFSRVLAGPYCTMLLGDLGATVIKVESPSGDETRTWLPPHRNGVATYYLAINRNKRSITLDFNDPADLRLAQELAARADIFIENFKPGSLKRFGLDYDTIRQQNRRRPACGGELARLGALGVGQPDVCLCGRRRHPDPHGQRSSEPVPLRTAANGGSGSRHRGWEQWAGYQ